MKRLEDSYTTDQEYLKLATIATLNNDILIPLNSFNIQKVPQKVTIYYGKDKYERLDDLVDSIYQSRRYSISKEAAKSRIEALLLKGLAQNKTVYGKAIKYKFDFIDASKYDIKY